MWATQLSSCELSIWRGFRRRNILRTANAT
jgi:hypothetical protein